jgi:large subunit ribosomal protein L3
MKGLIGKKVGMTQVFDEEGAALPVTLIEAGPCYVTQIRKESRDGYSAVQLGFEEVSSRRLSGGQLGHLQRSGAPALRYLREFRVKEPDVKLGEVVTVESFAIGERVDVTGTSKGKGFQGGVRRYGFGGGPKTHGQSDRQRAPGSVGATSTPGRVFKGKRMPGHMGSRQVTSENIEVEYVDPEKNLIGVRGSVPGPKGSVVFIREARKQ